MSSPPRSLEIHCRQCGAVYTKWQYWPCINLTSEPWTPDEIAEATTATCPECGVSTRLLALVIDGAEFRILGRPDDAEGA